MLCTNNYRGNLKYLATDGWKFLDILCHKRQKAHQNEGKVIPSKWWTSLRTEAIWAEYAKRYNIY